ncbi:PAS domain S-box-containing protein/diguanylate cyclase (GGDEF)-like protein [Chromohalobacter marismortui]|uniref:cyclic-guanylate-specific phosphodiesterase n=1 Tax=Chromohalobacter marismortui TaxID=42055 RepID=A0A4R7NS07_9GAMM|nr:MULTISPECIES: EAL domain-containing protein [Chromohalobacter]MCI0509312.1 EAL domain-containing protein [Chromohalobacter sp.]MCI0593860.1 EAL domain-containing protein [Chromohalobacter sp.]TDU23795.1 PAS domain S-box-containing protein/diguanylate cyclase (GGDEF)-like protein [Chromohalobacter marismortui]
MALFLTSQGLPDAIQGEWDVKLIALSCLVAWVAAGLGLLIGDRMQEANGNWRRQGWLLAGAGMMGLGVWSMHFTGMLALRLPLPMQYDVGLTLLSLLPAMLGSGYALRIMAMPRPHLSYSLVGGIVLGMGIGIMHYLGMEAMRMPVAVRYDATLFFISLGVALVLGMVAMLAHRYCVRHRRLAHLDRRLFGVAACISLAISGMHYTAMSATYYLPTATPVPQQAVAPASWLGVSVSGIVTFLLMIAGLWVFIARRLQRHQRQSVMSREQLMEVIAAINDAFLLFDDQGRIVLSNRTFSTLTGYTPAEIHNQPLSILEYSHESAQAHRDIQRFVAQHGQWQGEIEARRKNGEAFPVRVSVNRVDYSHGNAHHFVATLHDLSAHREAEAKIHRLAHHDPLTDLPNRQTLHRRLGAMQARCHTRGQSGALIMLDIDNFKALNDSRGNAAGDMLLRHVTRRLARFALHEHDLARLGGNEFALVVTDLPSDRDAATVELQHRLSTVQQAVGGVYDLDGFSHTTTHSLGGVWFHAEDIATEELVKRASLALSRAKQDGGNACHVFHPELEAALHDRVWLEAELRKGLQDAQMRLLYQPQVDAEGTIIGAEALIRWQHPERGMISPGAFIPLAEETGLIVPMGHWVLAEACERLARWATDPALAHLQLSVNVSVHQFQQHDFVAQVLAALADYQAPPERLTLELTESLLLANVESVIEKMMQLKHHGVSFSLDDFGTGYSSLAYLKRLPFNALKIDISFVRDVLVDANDAAIVKTIIALADSLQLKTVAEGVETLTQRDFLARLGCHHYQGYYYGRPGPAEDFEALITPSYAPYA